MRTTSRWLIAVGLLVCSILGFSQTQPASLHVGDPAPSLEVGKWVKGSPVNAYSPSQTYVIVFWSTWCPAFLGAMDHLNELQNSYSDRTQVVAVSVFERSQGDVVSYVDHFTDKMGFSIAMDKVPPDDRLGTKGAMVQRWLQTSQELGLPIAFIVDHKGNIAWIGSPVGNGMDDPLRKIIDNTWDSGAYAQKLASEQENALATSDLTNQMSVAINAGNWDKALQLCDEMVPYDKRAAVEARFLIMLRKEDFENAYAFCRDTAAGPAAKDAMTIYALAWLIVNPEAHWKKTDFDFGLQLAKQAVDLSYDKNVDMLDVLAWAYFQKKDKQNAIDTENLAISMARDDQKGKLELNLKTFKH